MGARARAAQMGSGERGGASVVRSGEEALAVRARVREWVALFRGRRVRVGFCESGVGRG